MDKIPLSLDQRDTFGKHNNALRRSGMTPAHLFGHGVHSLALQGPTADLERVVARAGTSRLISLKVGTEKRSRTVLVREVQRKPVSGQLLHVDLYQVKSKERMTVDVPVHVVGEAPALTSKANSLEVELSSLSVECLPSDLPARLDVDVSGLKNPGDSVRVGDIQPPHGVTILNDHELVVARIETERRPAIEVEEEEEAAEEAAEAAETEPDQSSEG